MLVTLPMNRSDECHKLEAEALAYPGRDSCPPTWDSVLCWPRTKIASLAVQPCIGELFGIQYDTSQNASRWCWSNGTWADFSNYTQCKELRQPLPEVNSGVEITTWIYFFGYGISLLALIIAVIIYLSYRELRCLRNIIHTHLMFTYILADSLWILMTFSQVSLQTNIPLCIIFYSMYHYFHLTNFFWMFIEGWYLYLLVVKTFSGDNIKLKVCLFIGWGLPFLVVIVWGIAKSAGGDPENNGYQESALSRHCPWMIPHRYDWIYQGPALIVLVTNVVFLSLIMWVLITKLRSANNAETQQYRKAAKALLVLIPLLGVTYILVIYGPSEGHTGNIFNGCRAVLLSLQGLFVALFYCFMNSEVKNSLRHHYERWSTARSLGAGTRYYAHWAPRSRTESIRLYSRPAATAAASPAAAAASGCGNNHELVQSPCNNHGKETTVSEATTTTTVFSANNSLPIIALANAPAKATGLANGSSGRQGFFGRFKRSHI